MIEKTTNIHLETSWIPYLSLQWEHQQDYGSLTRRRQGGFAHSRRGCLNYRAPAFQVAYGEDWADYMTAFSSKAQRGAHRSECVVAMSRTWKLPCIARAS